LESSSSSTQSINGAVVGIIDVDEENVTAENRIDCDRDIEVHHKVLTATPTIDYCNKNNPLVSLIGYLKTKPPINTVVLVLADTSLIIKQAIGLSSKCMTYLRKYLGGLCRSQTPAPTLAFVHLLALFPTSSEILMRSNIYYILNKIALGPMEDASEDLKDAILALKVNWDLILNPNAIDGKRSTQNIKITKRKRSYQHGNASSKKKVVT
ncbi:hypothetical protein HDU99_000367, partial [Rhizoclosmatium hyalinum]